MKFVFWAAAALTCTTLLSCTAGTEGIFASISREQKIQALGGISAAATITSLAQFNGNFYATGGAALFTRSSDEGTVTWNSSTVGGSEAVTSVAVAGTAGTNQAVFAAANNRLYVSSDGSTWNDVTSQLGLASDASVNTVVLVRSSDGYSTDRFVVVSSEPIAAASNSTLPNYNKISLVTGFSAGVIQQTGPVAVVGDGTPQVTTFQAPVFTAVRTSAGEYYVASESYLWHLDASFSNLGLVTNSVSYNGFGGLLDVQNSGHDQLFLTTMSNSATGGGLYVWTSPTGTTPNFASIVSNQKDVNDESMSLTTMIYNPINQSLWIGTGPVKTLEGDGYAEYTFSSGSYSTNPNTNIDNYDSTVLPTSSVGCFWINPVTTTVVTTVTATGQGNDGTTTTTTPWDGLLGSTTTITIATSTSGGVTTNTTKTTTVTTRMTFFMGMSAEGLWRWDPNAKQWTEQ